MKQHYKRRMRKSRLSKNVQAELVECFVVGTTALCAAKTIGINGKTSSYISKGFVRLSIFI